MKILILNSGRGWGGIETHSIVLGAAFLAAGHQVTIACRPGGVVEENAMRAGIRIERIHISNALDLNAVRRIVRKLKQDRYDAMLVNLGKEYWPATVAGKLAGVKTILLRHQLDEIKPLTGLLLRFCSDRIVAVSEAVKLVLLKAEIPKGKIEVIYPGTDLSRFQQSAQMRAQVRKEMGIVDQDIIIGSAGKLHAGKGIYELLEAGRNLLATHPNIKLLYVGEGPERSNLETMIHKFGMDKRVILAGFRNDMERMYAAMDIFALPSKYLESFGLVLVEAMAAGLPVVAAAKGGMVEIIENESSGLLVEAGSSTELQAALKRLLDDPELCQHIINRGRQRAYDVFSVDAMVIRFEELIDDKLLRK